MRLVQQHRYSFEGGYVKPREAGNQLHISSNLARMTPTEFPSSESLITSTGNNLQSRDFVRFQAKEVAELLLQFSDWLEGLSPFWRPALINF